ncbi:hypothetical protein VNO77_22690 [Canavalia gladiata]|uniref:Uncharacterized protein n=1 Tax=Canavalia gladiata TaxID=3824 RepID=A0AAN9QEP4_CANGL
METESSFLQQTSAMEAEEKLFRFLLSARENPNLFFLKLKPLRKVPKKPEEDGKEFSRIRSGKEGESFSQKFQN